MKKMISLVLVATLACGISSCAMDNESAGTLTGGAVGALIGSQFGSGAGQGIAIAAGMAGGAIIGNQIGQYMDRQDRMALNAALEEEADHHVHAWRNPNNGNEYRVEPVRTYYRPHHKSQPCREYRTTAIIGGKRQQIYGKACRTADGDWRVVS